MRRCRPWLLFELLLKFSKVSVLLSFVMYEHTGEKELNRKWLARNSGTLQKIFEVNLEDKGGF